MKRKTTGQAQDGGFPPDARDRLRRPRVTPEIVTIDEAALPPLVEAKILAKAARQSEAAPVTPSPLSQDDVVAWAMARGFVHQDRTTLTVPYKGATVMIELLGRAVRVSIEVSGRRQRLCTAHPQRLRIDEYGMLAGAGLSTSFLANIKTEADIPAWFTEAYRALAVQSLDGLLADLVGAVSAGPSRRIFITATGDPIDGHHRLAVLAENGEAVEDGLIEVAGEGDRQEAIRLFRDKHNIKAPVKH